MVRTHLRSSLAAATAVMLLGGGSHLLAIPVSYIVDPLRSSLSLSGGWYGQKLVGASEGSLITSYTGSIDADLTNGSIQFTGANLAAMTSGDYQPGLNGGPGKAAADYAGVVSAAIRRSHGEVLLALRDVDLGLSSRQLRLGSDGAFKAAGVVGDVSGTLDYAGLGLFGALGHNQAPIHLAGLHNARGTGEISQANNIETLEIPIDIEVTPAATRPDCRSSHGFPAGVGGFKLHLEGMIFATRDVPVAAVPEPATGLFLASGAVVLLRRRRVGDARQDAAT
jgi:hypothetical protein